MMALARPVFAARGRDGEKQQLVVSQGQDVTTLKKELHMMHVN